MKENEFIQKYNSIVLFDGVCNLCCSSVQFIIKQDTLKSFVFIPLSSEAGKKLTAFFKYESKSGPSIESIILIDNKILYDKSSAVLRIGTKLKGLKTLSKVCLFIPKLVRDFVYGIIAKNRYSIFGKKDSCMIPSPDLKKRFFQTI